MILYWFRPAESKTLHPVLDCIDLIVAKVEEVRGLPVPGTPLPVLYWVTSKVDGPESGSVICG
jgi:hypothetical protein